MRAELGAFHLRRSQPEEAEAAAKSALAIDDNSVEGHRVLGLVYAGYADGGSQNAVRPPQVTQYLKDAITHLEQASASTLRATSSCNFTLGRLYLRAGDAGESGAGADARGRAEPGVGAGAPAAGAGAGGDTRRGGGDRDARCHR